MYNLDARCRDGWFTLKDPDDASWVEYWSGVLQLWDSPQHCGGLKKGMPLSFFRGLTVWHMTDTKLYSRGRGVAPVDDIVAGLEAQRAEMLAEEEAKEGEESSGRWWGGR